ncbi:protein-glutamate O-methyltransferase CheR [Desulfonatronum sp. SC1]|uniref:CheR family methyltransferase n=1 Tax=Desulfonatronum sp. SC1 TaxID=2109626 RepID=UPI000D318D75|nr:protein-glutamate O-methyltransferase CheR [Desulfonatronum sp. SC1]PTN38713.1 chemotaxis protein [Desulfonatronum sp. SC1]
MSAAETEGIKDADFLQLRDFIYAQSGIFIPDNRKYLLEKRLSNRVKNLNLKNYGEYLHFLKYDSGRRQELPRLFEVITTNETSFYRNPPQLNVFQNIVLPQILERLRKKGKHGLHIWSAGCSTGEEPYTLAIILHEVLNSELASWNIRITANDLSEAVLRTARQGIYSDYALRTTPKDIVRKYFIEEAGRFRVRQELKNMITFGQLNLNDRSQVKLVPRSEVAFCRNVIIYFDDAMKKRVISAFYDNLVPEGLLFIGHSESLHHVSRAWQPKHYPGSIVYYKEA